MRYLNDQKGMAMAMALVLALIALAIISGLIYTVTQGTRVSGFEKGYQTALEAGKGGIELFTREIVNETFQGSLSNLLTTYSTISLSAPSGCLLTKLTMAMSSWGSCSSVLDPKSAPDIIFRLPGTPPQSDFTVFVKVVETVGGNTDISGEDLLAMGVTESGSGLIAPKHFPNLYRVEFQAERATNPSEQANLSVLYAY